MDCLPDELVIHILSFLPSKAAAKTSILSTRFRHLWKLTARLLLRITNGNDRKILQLTHSALSSFENPNSYQLRELSIRCSFFDSINTDVTVERWISFAIDLHDVHALNLSLFLHEFDEYSFPPPSSCNRNNNLMHLSLSSRCKILPSFEFFRNLRSITLERCCVVSDAVIESINLNCAMLERLVLSVARQLVHFRVSSSLCHLKYLRVSFCPDLKTVSIESPNLTALQVGYLKFAPLQAHHLHVPSLKELTLNCRAAMCNTLYLLESSTFRNVEKLDLIVDLRHYHPNFGFLHPCGLNRVKELSLSMYFMSEDLRGLNAILRACSSVEILHLSFGDTSRRWETPDFHEPIPGGDWMIQSLERIRMEEFDHREYSHLIILKYLVKVSLRLAEVKIKVCFQDYDDIRKSKRCIKDFIGDKLCHGAKLVILPFCRRRRRRCKRTTKDDESLTTTLSRIHL